MMTLKIPGVYVQEIPTLPPGVAEVNSAIPAFIGYTELSKFNEIVFTNQPIKIQSMLEFVRIFGRSAPFTISGVTENLAATETNATVENQYYMYDSLQLYFLNGGGPCYIVSVGSYPGSANETDFENGLNALDLFDEPTIYLFPDAVKLTDDELAKLQQLSLKKCGELMDRFSILDFKMNNDASQTLKSASEFRDKIGMANLNYAAAYTPWLKTTLDKDITASSITGIFTQINKLGATILNNEINGKKVGVTVSEYKSLLDNLISLKDTAAITTIFVDFASQITAYASGAKKAKNPFVAGEVFDPVLIFATPSANVQTFFNAEVKSTISGFETEYGTITGGSPTEIAENKANYLNALLNNASMVRFKNLHEFVSNGLKTTIDSYESFMTENIPYYSSLLKILKNKLTTLPPSGAMAGLYCKTDNEKGVWKAPANISVSAVSGVAQLFSNSDLGDLNVDAVAGKSINVIRPITGYGTMVMGARTLSGNDSEWRYIPVRRLFIFIEENLKKSTAWAVFEPNDRLLWLKVRSQIENYLFELWRRGALAGAKPEHSYQVNCGLNSTMTAQDVLEGKLLIEIKLAAVRPAEFIVLKFSHQLQKS